MTELRLLRDEVTDEVVAEVRAAAEFRELFLPQLQAEVDAGHLEADVLTAPAKALNAHFERTRTWESASALSGQVEALRELYVKRRGAILASHGAQVEEALQSLKLRRGFDQLGQDAQHQVLEVVRDGAPFDTKPESPAPSLTELRAGFPLRLSASVDKALGLLDELRQEQGDKPTVTVRLETSGREFEGEAEVERFLSELRAQLLHQIQSGHRVRIK